MKNFSIYCKKYQLKNRIEELMTIRERMALSAGLQFGGVNTEGNIFIGSDDKWENLDVLEREYNK